MRPRYLALVLAAAVIVPACGDDGSEDASGTTDATATAAETTTSSAAPEAAAGDGATADDGATAGSIEGPDAEAAAAAVATVFDSSRPFDEKVALLEGGEAHRADHDAYLAAAEAVGGISVEPTAVAVAGDDATVTYAVSFAGTQMYDGLTMDAVRSGGGWIVPTGTFCDFLAAARTACA